MFDGGQAWAHPLVVLRAHPNGTPYTRCGFVAGKKVGGAVARNRAKRLLREAVRRVPLPLGYDLVWIARAGAPAAPFTQVQQAVADLLERARPLWGSLDPS